MKHLFAFWLSCLVCFYAAAQGQQELKYRELVYEQSTHGLFSKAAKPYFTIRCEVVKKDSRNDSTYYIYQRTGTSVLSGKKRFTSVDTIIIHKGMLEYSPNFFNLDTVNVSDNIASHGMQQTAFESEKNGVNYSATISIGDKQKFALNPKEQEILPPYYTETTEKSKIEFLNTGYSSSSGSAGNSSVGGRYTGNGRSTYETVNGSSVEESSEQFKGRIQNRMVKGKESIVTKAGTFDCWVIEGQAEKYKNFNVLDYFSPEVGLIKREFRRKSKTFISIVLIKAT